MLMHGIKTVARLCRTRRRTVTVAPSGDCFRVTQTPITVTTEDAREYTAAVWFPRTAASVI